MVTKVGMQLKFSDAIKDLLELEYDALEAYEYALDKLESDEYSKTIEEFTQDHKRHIQEISSLLKTHETSIPSGPSAKQWLTKGKVFMTSIFGDKAILSAMHSNEIDTNTAYERIIDREDIWDEAKDIIRRALEDERRHKAWLERVQ